jgi:oligopeptide transport system substrate-binding protein
MRKRRMVWSAFVLAIALAAVGSAIASTTSSSSKGVLKMVIGAEPPSLDPGLATDTTSSNILLNIMDPLVKLGPPPALKPLPNLAQSWTVNGTHVTLHLRHDGRWTNGQPVTAQDFVWSWLRTLSPELAADYAYQFFGIVGAEAYNGCDPAKADCNALKAKVGISASGRYTIHILLTTPQPWFIQQLSHNSFLAVNRAAVTKYGNKWTEPGNIVTNGPFKLASWKHDAQVTLTKWTKFRYAKTVKLNSIVMNIITDGSAADRAFDSGSVDVNDQQIAIADIPRYKKTPYWKSFKALGTYYYGVNVKNIPDVNERRALAYAVKRQDIIDNIAQAGQEPAKAFTPIGIAGGPLIDAHGTLPTNGDANKAKAAFAKAKSPLKNITLFVNNSPGHAQIATAVQSYWQPLGLTATVKVMEWKQFLQFLGPPPDNSVDVYRSGWIADYPDAYNFLSLWTCKSGNNNTNWCNTKFDALVDKAAHTPDLGARNKVYQQAEDILTGPNGEFPIIPIYWYTFNDLVRQNVHGLFLNPMDQYDFAKVSVS